MVVVPELCSYENLFTSDEALGNSTTNTFTSFLFILIVVSAVEEAVPSLDSLDIDLSIAFEIVHFQTIG